MSRMCRASVGKLKHKELLNKAANAYCFFANILLTNTATRVSTRRHFSYKMDFGTTNQKHYSERKSTV